MVFASRPRRYATTAGPWFAALFSIGFAIAQTPGMKIISFGGNDQESLAGFAIDHDGNYYIAGTTASLDLPVNVLQKHPGGAYLYRFRAGHSDPLYPWPAPVSAIATDPSHPGYLYASFNRAVWRSPDSGDSWQHLDADWPTAADCTGITIAPKGGRTLYVLCPATYFLTRSRLSSDPLTQAPPGLTPLSNRRSRASTSRTLRNSGTSPLTHSILNPYGLPD